MSLHLNHTLFLKLAIDESKCSVDQGSSPFGAVIVKPGDTSNEPQILAKAHNCVVLENDPTAHAEVVCIRKACQTLGSFDLSGCVLYTSCEPCPMCLNAAKWANIHEIYYAADRNDADAIGFRDRVFYEDDPVTLTKIDLKEAREIMDFWHALTTKKTY